MLLLCRLAEENEILSKQKEKLQEKLQKYTVYHRYMLKKWRCFVVVVQTGRGERDTVQAEGETAGEAAEVHGVPPLHGEGAGGRGGVPRTA